MTEQHNPITIYTTRLCGFCHAAKRFFKQRDIGFDEIAADGNPELRADLLARTGQRTVPQIWINDHHVGGFTDLMELDNSGELDKLLGR